MNLRTIDLPDATPTSAGAMSAEDKAKLDGLLPGEALSVVSRSSDFTAATNTHYRVDTSGGSVTATLPAPSSANLGQIIEFKKIAAANSMVLSSAALIDGASSQTVTTQWSSVTVRSTGSTWDIV